MASKTKKNGTKYYTITVDDTPLLQGPNKYQNATSLQTSPEGSKIEFINDVGKEVTLIGFKKVEIVEQDAAIAGEDSEEAERAD